MGADVGGSCHGLGMSESEPETLRGRTFKNLALRGSRFIGCDLGDVVVRGSDVAGMEIESPWLMEGGSRLLVNGVDVVPLVDAQLNNRFPGRSLRDAEDPEGLRAAWAALEKAWAALVDRAVAMPAGAIDTSVDVEWSLAQTLRHLVMATDTWLGRAILDEPQPYHPVGLPHDDDDGSVAYDASVFSAATPSFSEVCAVRADRQDMVRSFLTTVTSEVLAAPRPNPHAPQNQETGLSCLRTILEEEWEHLRYAERDLDIITERPSPSA